MQPSKQNYQLILDKTLSEIKQREAHPSLLLHACCAPCSSYVLEYLSGIFDITLFFYNPNISPQSEYTLRYEELSRLVGEMELSDSVRLVKGDYDHDRFLDMARGLEQLPEGGERCRGCYALRLEAAAKYAKAHGFDYFTTTLSISPHKNSTWLCEIGGELSGRYDIPYLVSDFKKRNGYKRSCELSDIHSLYRQAFCGCAYSRRDAEARAEQQKKENV